jgi:eukaryotic-like serine/threonine-protein kinase
MEMSWEQTNPLHEAPSAERALAATAYDGDRVAVEHAPGPVDSWVGQRIDHFHIVDKLGEGGMGAVYLAQDLSLGRTVAIKVLRRELASDQRLVDRLVLEAQAQARLQHPNVVTIYYIGSFAGAPYFAMEYVPGATLSDHIEREGPLPWGEALEYIIQTTRALAAAHACGMVHRDIKPSNLLLGAIPAGAQSNQIKVADFGVAAPAGTADDGFVGTPYYAAPEQIAGGGPTLRGDVYALGITFHELLTGNVPFQADNLAAMLQQHREAPRPDIPAEDAPWRLRHLIREMMDPDPHNRPGSYEDLLDRLESLRSKPRVAGGLVPRAAALVVDVMITAPLGQVVVAAFSLSQRAAAPIWLVLFGTYYVLSHRLWGKTLGKRLLGLRIVGTTRAVRASNLLLRFAVEFWGPLVALAIISLQWAAAVDLESAKLASAVAGAEAPLWNRGTEALLRMLLVPNLIVAIPWLAGFLFALFDRDRRALHDRTASTRVIYEIQAREEVPGSRPIPETVGNQT